MNQAVMLSIVVAVQHAQKNVAEIVRAVAPAVHPQVELLFCHTAADPEVPELVGSQSEIRLISGPPGSLIPHLWRDGILAARGERVATTTAHCIPAQGWIEALMAADLKDAAYGGIIKNDSNADAKARAIFLLRYSAFAPPEIKRDVREIAADNALYRRSDLLRHTDLLQLGFWEPSFHSRFQVEGIRLILDPELQVIHRNRYSAREFIAQRFAHGHEFGLARARSQSFSFLRNLLFIFLAPCIFVILINRIVSAARQKSELRKQLKGAWVWLAVFTLAWTVGETSGYASSIRDRFAAPRWER
jgi:Glycosyl transferase family 2